MVFYRKYRPQTISELNLSSVRARLKAVLLSPDIPHAFLFTGSKGLGKTSSARILAKAINCQSKKKDSIEPCNECEICKSITAGSHIDVLEIDAASNRGIDEIRDLREKIKFSPSSLQKKVYIIDEVHMLTAEAFNALLKTLEEPPSHVLFVLCTTELHKVPATIVSRSFHVSFEKPSPDEIKAMLGRIVHDEKLTIENSVYDRIVELSEDSFRDAAKILEELALLGQGKIDEELIEKHFKTANLDSALESWLVALSEKDSKKALDALGELASVGVDFGIAISRAVQLLRGHLVIILSQGEKKFNLSAAQTRELLIALQEANKHLKYTPIPSLPLELVTIDFCIEKEVPRVERREQEEKNVAAPVQKAQTPVKTPQSKEEVKEREDENSANNQSILYLGEQHSKQEFFRQLLDAVKAENQSIAGVLRGSKFTKMSDEAIYFETAYTFHKDKLSEPKAQATIEKHASSIVGKQLKFVVNLAEK